MRVIDPDEIFTPRKARVVLPRARVRARPMRIAIPGRTRPTVAMSYRPPGGIMRGAPPSGLGWIAEVVIAVVTIATKLYQRKRAKDKVKLAKRIEVAQVKKVQDAIAKEQAEIDAKNAPTTALALTPNGTQLTPAAGSRKGLVMVALGIGAYMLLRKKRRNRRS